MVLNKLYKSFNIEPKEFTPVSILIVQSIFLGIFTGSFDIGAHTLFLKAFPEEMIAKAYIISGLVGIILTAIYSNLQAKLAFSKLAKNTFLFIAIATLLLRVLFQVTEAHWVIFLTFILFGPLNILAIVTFWGTVSRIFNLRQGKRLFGIIDAGQIFGIILSSYIIPLILAYLSGTKDLFLICAISAFLAMGLELLISKKYQLNLAQETSSDSTNETAHQKEQVTLKQIAQRPYLLFMALFVIFSMFTAFFVQFSFLVVINEQYPSETELARYLGFFTGSMMIFTFLIKTFVYSKFVKAYGLKISLIISPVLIAIFTIMAILAGYLGGYEANQSSFVFFFLLISLSKLFNKALKDSLEVPSFKLLYQSLSKKIRFDIQAKVDGTINEIAALTSGILLSILGILAFITIIHYSIVLLVILLAWTLITIKLYKHYRVSLEESLGSQQLKRDLIDYKSEFLHSIKNLDSSEAKLNKIKLLRTYCPIEYKFWFNDILQAIQWNIKDYGNSFLSQDILLLKDNTTIEAKLNISLSKFSNSQKKYSSRELSQLLHSDSFENLLEAYQFINKQENSQKQSLITALLRYPNLKVQQYAIFFAAKFKHTETANTIIDFIEIKELKPNALIALHGMLPYIENSIIQAFYKTDIKLDTQLHLIKLLEDFKSEKSIHFLLDNLSVHRADIIRISLKALIKLGFQAEEENRPRLFQIIQSSSQILAWDIAALASLENNNEADDLLWAIQDNYNNHLNRLMDVLSITYHPDSVAKVKEFLESGTSEGVSYGLELLDLFISEEVKPFLLPIFEDVPLSEKVRELQNHFPVRKLTFNELILNILSRDPNLISSFTKELAVKHYSLNFNELKSELIALLFSPDIALANTVANQVQLINPESYNKIKTRLTHNHTTIRLSNEINPEIKFDAFKKLKSHFNEISLHAVDWQKISTVDYFNSNSKESDSIESFDFVLDTKNESEPLNFLKDGYNSDLKMLNYGTEDHYKLRIPLENLNHIMTSNTTLIQHLIIYM